MFASEAGDEEVDDGADERVELGWVAMTWVGALLTEVTTIVTGGGEDPPCVGDCVTIDVKTSVVGGREDAVFVTMIVLGPAAELCDSISDDTDAAIEEDTEASALADWVSDTCEDVDDGVVDVTVESMLSAKGGQRQWEVDSSRMIHTGRVGHAGQAVTSMTATKQWAKRRLRGRGFVGS